MPDVCVCARARVCLMCVCVCVRVCVCVPDVCVRVRMCQICCWEFQRAGCNRGLTELPHVIRRTDGRVGRILGGIRRHLRPSVRVCPCVCVGRRGGGVQIFSKNYIRYRLIIYPRKPFGLLGKITVKLRQNEADFLFLWPLVSGLHVLYRFGHGPVRAWWGCRRGLRIITWDKSWSGRTSSLLCMLQPQSVAVISDV